MARRWRRRQLPVTSWKHDPDLVAIVADRLQGHLRERAKRGDVIKAGKRRDAQWALAPALV